MNGHKDSSGNFHPHSDSSSKLSSHQVESSKHSSVNHDDVSKLKNKKSKHIIVDSDRYGVKSKLGGWSNEKNKTIDGSGYAVSDDGEFSEE